MADNQAEFTEALITLLDVAQQDIADHIINNEPVDAMRNTCIGHLENIMMACERAGQDNLYLVIDSVLSFLDADADGFTNERCVLMRDWCGEAKSYLESSGQSGFNALLDPLPAEMRESLLMIVESMAEVPVTEQAAEEVVEEIVVEAADTNVTAFPVEFPEEEAPPGETIVEVVETIEMGDEAAAAGVAAAIPFPEMEERESASVTDFPGDEETESETAAALAFPEEEEPDFDSDNLLGMLAYEIQSVTPQLADLASNIANSDEAEDVQKAGGEYLEIISRVATISDELGLNGLALVCSFISDNINIAVDQDATERKHNEEAFSGWPQVIVEHLNRPDDDQQCVAVVDFLEHESWPEPFPYRDQRALIEGLTQAITITSEFEAEVREVEATEDDVSLDMSADASPELIEAFFAESPGHAETLSGLMELISQGTDVQGNVEAAQRIAHTLKGSGNLVGVKGIANISHHIEDIFDYIAKHKMQPPRALANTMQEATDSLEAMIEALQGQAPPPEDAQRVLQDVLDWANRIDSGQIREEDFREAPPAAVAEEKTSEPQGQAVEDASEAASAEIRETVEAGQAAAAPEQAEVVRVPLKLLDDIFRVVSETAITTGQIQERLTRLESGEKQIRKNDGSMQQQRYDLENLVSVRGMAARHRGAGSAEDAAFDPLEMDEYDEFYGATHAFIEVVADSREILRDFSGEVYELEALFLEHQRLNKELQQLVMTTRMVPVSMIASRLQRTVRQVCRATGKDVELTILGEKLQLDGDVLNKLANPLMHMLRNAVDHGIEEPTLRESRGKSRTGQIILSFEQEGNNVAVKCIDDGRGLDYDRIRRVAVERGLVADAEALDKPNLAKLILRSGFSTSTKVTQVSGRGVGMDVVHTAIQSLNGTMEILDGNDHGTVISLRLPITLLTSHCLLVGVGKSNMYAVPTISLTQILSPGTGQIGMVGGKLTYQLDQEVYTASTLNSLIGVPEAEGSASYEDRSVLLVQSAEGVKAVLVEKVVTSYDLVIKNMGAYIKSISGIAGVSMLGDGEVVAVLDLSAMLQTQNSPERRYRPGITATPIEEDVSLPKVLIVDDSLSVRNSLAQLMSDSGYQPVLARDGLEAINVLENEGPDIVLTDLEMPRMNGLEFTSYVRNSEQWNELPVVMITSRSMAKHREQADRVGISRYITKPFTDDEIIECIETELSSLA